MEGNDMMVVIMRRAFFAILLAVVFLVAGPVPSQAHAAVTSPAHAAASIKPAAVSYTLSNCPSSMRSATIVKSAATLYLKCGSKTVATTRVSTGKAGYRTPSGTFHVYDKYVKSWSYKYQTWMPYAVYFYGGYAIHYGETWAPYLSHGCVRAANAKMVYNYLPYGAKVVIR